MAKLPELASVAELDERLKRIDEPRWLASRYAPPGSRRCLVAIGLLAGEIRRAMGMSEAMLGRIRVQWWRESIDSLLQGGPVRRHDLVEELAATTHGRPDLLAAMLRYFDAADAVLDDHLTAGGHVVDAAHAERHIAAEAALMQASALALAPDLSTNDADRIALCADGWLAQMALLPQAEMRWAAAQQAFAGLTPTRVPAVAHLAAGPGETEDRPLSIRWRIFLAVLTRRLPAA